MSIRDLKVASLSESAVGSVKELEASLGKTVVAYESVARKFAELTADETRRLQETERKLGVTLIAYD